MKIRKARVEDAEKATELIWTAIEQCANAFAGSNDPAKISKRLQELFKVSYNRMSYEICTVVEDKDKVIGAMITYPGCEMKELDKKIIERLKIEHPKGTPGYEEFVIPVIEAKETFDDEYYIDSLAVDKEYQGKKIGTHLIKYAEEMAREKNYDKLAILAEENNNRACSLYRYLGFKDDCILVIGGHSYNHLVKKI
ncbi:MAG: GNAT family N-acetyltransferase [Tissierellales bacterium]|jgi:ribosomal protein S18 acetylase RimI-like enzyme|nr:GNAT family N-acetyltransferase [Tissierellales bacterium]